MIQLGSIFQIPLCHHTCDRIDKEACVSYAASNDAYTVDESFTQIDLPSGIEKNIHCVM